MSLERETATEFSGTSAWWTTRWFAAALILMSAVPLCYPSIPPLVDLPGHMGRYRVMLDGASGPLAQFYEFHWALIGNLGADLLVYPLAKLFGLELAVKLVALSIPPMTVAGFLWVAREIHGRLPPTALLALPFALAHPFMFGFLNFTLAMALAFLAFGLWLRLAKLGRFRLRALLFVPISCIVWLTHMFGWGVLGLLCFSAEAVRQHDRGRGWIRSGCAAVLQCMPLTLPLVPIMAWRHDLGGAPTIDWFDWSSKWRWIRMALRDRWEWFDLASVSIAGLALFVAIFHRKLTFSRHLGFSTLILALAFIGLPRMVFGSAYADMRLVPFVMACALLAIRFKPGKFPRLGGALAVAGLVFYGLRVAANTASLIIADDAQHVRLAALDHVPRGARLVHLVGQDCGLQWAVPRHSHLGGMAIVRRSAFSNDQWIYAGANLLTTHIEGAWPFLADPSQIVRSQPCAVRGIRTLDQALAAIPPGAFDYLWLIDSAARNPRLPAGTTLVWSGPGSSLYRLGGAPKDVGLGPQQATDQR